LFSIMLTEWGTLKAIFTIMHVFNFTIDSKPIWEL